MSVALGGMSQSHFYYNYFHNIYFYNMHFHNLHGNFSCILKCFTVQYEMDLDDINTVAAF